MTMNEHESIWLAKLAAWTHDPAEKALVLLRDPLGHEGGTVRVLRSTLFPEGLPGHLLGAARTADHWASAADRPQFPRSAAEGPFAAWAQVRFDREPELIHPLSGDTVQIAEGFPEEPEHLKAVSTDHFLKLVARHEDGTVDYRKTALAFWRFGPETPASGLEALWSLLPADTRVPDHTIWAHLDLTAAFATAFSGGDGGPALLVMSFGPVQDFIAQSRSTSDLWAGSHLLSRLAWEGMKAVCERWGPDCILFPQLRGIPLVDLWLWREENLEHDLFRDASWLKSKTDSNPLFVAALPNRFVAVVPAGEAEGIAQEVTDRVRRWVLETSGLVLDELTRRAGVGSTKELYARDQIERQFEGFPEVHWAAVPWSLITEEGGRVDPSALQEALMKFYPTDTQRPGFLGTQGWEVLRSEQGTAEGVFFRPNPGVLYPALYDLLDRVAAASKSLRPFGQLPQAGYRCSLCGEREWLAARPEDLQLPPGERKSTLWARLSAAREHWNRKGEHLCAPCALKRLWPGIFVRTEVREFLEDVNRYVVSTHTMALSTSLEGWLEQEKPEVPNAPWTRQVLGGHDFAALPRKLERLLRNKPEEISRFVKGLPVYLDEVRDGTESPQQGEIEQAESIWAETEKGIQNLLGKKPEAYYALLLMDGDRLGAWISGTEDTYRRPYKSFWHSKIRQTLAERTPEGSLRSYLDTLRPSSPARHMAISGALNAFALHVTRHVLEDLYKGKLIYSGGDDVLAMICIDDLLPAMQTLRYLYGGVFPQGEEGQRVRSLLKLPSDRDFKIGNGHVRILSDGRKKLFRMMGSLATASVGAVVAHHMAPLGRVLRTLRQTEQRAKRDGGRNAFAVTVMKRGGGAVELTCPWFAQHTAVEPGAVELLVELCNLIASKRMSRRAVYLVQEWACDLPSSEVFVEAGGTEEEFRSMMEKTLARQFRRQATDGAGEQAADLARRIAAFTWDAKGRTSRRKPWEFIIDFMSVGEFLAREGRA